MDRCLVDKDIAWSRKDIPWTAHCSNENHLLKEGKDYVSRAITTGLDIFAEDLVFWCRA